MTPSSARSRTDKEDDFVAHYSRWRVGLIILAGLALMLVGLWMAGAMGEPVSSRRYPRLFRVIIGWLDAIFFGVGTIVLIKRLWTAREMLRIGVSGLWWPSYSDRTILWPDIKDVFVRKINRQTVIVLRLRDPRQYARSGLAGWSGLNRRLSGGDVAIALTGSDRSVADAYAAIERFRSGG